MFFNPQKLLLKRTQQHAQRRINAEGIIILFYLNIFILKIEFIVIREKQKRDMRHVFTIIIYLDCSIDCVTGHELVEWSHTYRFHFLQP